MLVRAIALSLALLIGGTIIIPLATDNVEAGQRKARKQRHYKKYSKRWWRQYRARQKRRRSSQARSRSLRLRQLRIARAAGTPEGVVATKTRSISKAVTPNNTWKADQKSPSQLQFRVDDSAGSQVGSASISVVGPSMGDSTVVGVNKSVGGVSTGSLRRDVINQMIRENGWVVNDYQKEIGGRTVYVVEAQSQSKAGSVQSRMFYFTEVDGRIYNVATNSSVEQQERLAAESEKVLDSLQNRVRGNQRAAVKE